MANKIIIIGGVAAGASAAAKARRNDEQAEITVYEMGPYVSFANCGLPYYIGRDIPERSDLFVMTPQRFKERFNINVKVCHEVTGIDKEKKNVTVKDLETGNTFTEAYDKLVIATGGAAIKPPLPGINLRNVFTLFTVPDLDQVEEALSSGEIKEVTVIGGGFIGIETVEGLHKRGFQVTLVEKLPQILPNFDEEMTTSLVLHLQDMGVRLVLGDGIKEFHGKESVTDVVLESGRKIPADMVIVSIGARPQLELVKRAGLALGKTGGVLVDATMRTSDPDIYAGGDIVETVHLITRKKVRIPLAGPANKQGRVIGANITGDHKTFGGVLGTAIVKVGDLTAGKTGLSEREAINEGIAYYVTHTPVLNHAGYYPGAEYMLLKLVVEQHSGRLLGAQAVGWQGVDKRIDVLATALHNNMRVQDLEDLDLAYAPPYSSARDPVLMAGYVASNVLRGEMGYVAPEEIRQAVKNTEGHDWQIVDVRTKKEQERDGYVPGAVLIPVDQLRERFGELDKNKKTAVYCKVGYRANLAVQMLKAFGFKQVYNVGGGYLGYASDVVRLKHDSFYKKKK